MVSQSSDTTPSGVDVLFIEDDAALAEMYRLKLVAEGYQVRIVRDAATGLRTALERLPDLLLLDLRLPFFHGFELLTQLRQAPGGAALPVIVLSNYGEADLIERGHRLGVLQHFIKSQTTPASLVEAIRRSLLQAPPASTLA